MQYAEPVADYIDEPIPLGIEPLRYDEEGTSTDDAYSMLSFPIELDCFMI